MQNRDYRLYSISDRKVNRALRLNVPQNRPFLIQEYSVLHVTDIPDIPDSNLVTGVI